MAVGVKVTLIVQLPPAATLAPQLLVCPKSPGLVPVKPMLVMVNAAPLGFESVTALAALVVPTFWLPKSGVEGGRLVGGIPVPDTPAVCGLLLALSVTVKATLRVPAVALLKALPISLIVQLPPAATLAPQLLVCPKSPGLVPVKPMLVMVNAVPLGFESVTALAALVVF